MPSALVWGGIAFVNTKDGLQATVWRSPFSDAIRQRLVSFANPTGDITNSDLELAATVVEHDVLASAFDLWEHTLSTSHGNTPAEAWQRKGSTTTLGPAPPFSECRHITSNTSDMSPYTISFLAISTE